MRKHIVHFPKDNYLKHNKLNDISKWKRHEGEWTGTREKFIISPPNSDYPRYMVKFPKYGSNETKIELFNCFLGLNLKLKIASYFPCIYKGKIGVVTKSFLKNKIELFEYIIDNSSFNQYIRYLVEPIERFNIRLVKYLLKNGFYLKDFLPDRQFAIIKILEMRKNILESIMKRYER